MEASPDRRDHDLAWLDEWAAVTVLAAAGSVPVLDPGRTAPPTRQPSRPGIAGLAGGKTGISSDGDGSSAAGLPI